RWSNDRTRDDIAWWVGYHGTTLRGWRWYSRYACPSRHGRNVPATPALSRHKYISVHRFPGDRPDGMSPQQGGSPNSPSSTLKSLPQATGHFRQVVARSQNRSLNL